MSEILLYAGLFFLTLSVAALGVILVLFIFLDQVSTAEEKLLETAHGNPYNEYKKRTEK